MVLGPEHAATVAAEGLSKHQVKAWLFEHAKILAGRFSPENFARFTQRDAARRGPITLDTAVPCAASADDILVFVAGGAGQHSCFIPTFGSTQAITRPLALKDGTPAATIGAFRQ